MIMIDQMKHAVPQRLFTHQKFTYRVFYLKTITNTKELGSPGNLSSKCLFIFYSIHSEPLRVTPSLSKVKFRLINY